MVINYNYLVEVAYYIIIILAVVIGMKIQECKNQYTVGVVAKHWDDKALVVEAIRTVALSTQMKL